MKHYYEHLLKLPVHLLADSYDYIERSDKAHDEKHIRAVVRAASMLCDRREVNDTFSTAAIMAALTHDLGCSIKNGRDKHEIYSAQIMRGLMSDYGYEEMLIELVVLAILQHRSSYKGVRKHIVAKIVAAADRCDALNPMVSFYRAYVYAKDVSDVCHDVAISHAHDHITHKYGPAGRSCLAHNELLSEFYPEECVSVTELMDTITEPEVRKLIEDFL